ncbi:MAG: AAA family ATPase [Candidatus Competibacteraceae bacterium]|jgi:chromosome partitioning protein|nr:AAA family ATPase [Candidatus Competibacteraceae bacterium]HPE73476.1 AAA family ATPase [Candidatus Competibacter sp.]HRW67347.1 AAA family ATPase [Candidatus Competibacter sp.]
MHIVSIVSQKGGAGKTTIAVNLAVAASISGTKGTVIDIDPQATASNWGDRRQAEMPQIISAQAARLPYILKQMEDASWVFIDTPPAISNTTMAAVKVADIVLVPSRAAIFDLDTLSTTLDLVRMGQKEAAVVLNAVPHRGSDAQEAKAVIAAYGANIAPISMGHRAAFQHSATLGLGVMEHEPNGKAAQEIRELFKWLQALT